MSYSSFLLVQEKRGIIQNIVCKDITALSDYFYSLVNVSPRIVIFIAGLWELRFEFEVNFHGL